MHDTVTTSIVYTIIYYFMYFGYLQVLNISATRLHVAFVPSTRMLLSCEWLRRQPLESQR